MLDAAPNDIALVHVNFPEPGSDTSGSIVIFECPHASNDTPPGYPIPPDFATREDHERWDPGSLKLARALRRQFHKIAWSIESRISRLIDDHNREEAYCCQPEITAEDRQRIIKTTHRPYINAVYGVINETIANGKFPFLFSIHTYNPHLDGYERKLFSVGGNPDSETVKALHRHLRAQLSKPDSARQLKALGLSEDRFLDEINKPYNLGPKLETGEKNPRLDENMAMRYALNYDFPWAHLETRNDFADQLVVRQIMTAAYDTVLNDPMVIADWKKRRDRYFESGVPEIPRPVAPGPMPRRPAPG